MVFKTSATALSLPESEVPMFISTRAAIDLPKGSYLIYFKKNNINHDLGNLK